MNRPRAQSAPSDTPSAVSPKTRRILLTTLLKSVSRAFYLSLRVLPADLREPIGLAYLLARAADAIADTPLIPLSGACPICALSERGLPEKPPPLIPPI